MTTKSAILGSENETLTEEETKKLMEIMSMLPREEERKRQGVEDHAEVDVIADAEKLSHSRYETMPSEEGAISDTPIGEESGVHKFEESLGSMGMGKAPRL